MSSDVLLVEKFAGYAVLTLNRPQSLNALSVDLLEALIGAIDSLRNDAAVQAIVLTGAGRAFCAGLDMAELRSGKLMRYLQADGSRDPARALSEFPGPVIAAINGPTATGGFEIAVACDVILASESARFVDTHSRIGLVPGWGLSQRLYRAVGIYRAKEIALTGRSLPAWEAAEWGLVNRVTSDDALMLEARKMADAMIGGFPGILPKIKAQIDRGSEQPLGEALAFERAYAANVSAALAPDRIALPQPKKGSTGGMQP